MTAGSSPSITDWIGSIGTAAAFMVAAVGFGYDRFRRRRTDRVAQARLVDGWLTDPRLGETNIRGATRSTLTFCGYISNASRQVVRRVRIQVVPWDEKPIFTGFVKSIGVVPPTSGDRPFQWSEEFTAGVGYPVDVDFQMAAWRGYDVFVRFTDSAGQRWVRHPDGTLKPTVDVAAEIAAEEDEMERLNPGYKEAMRRAGVLPPKSRRF